MTTIMVAMGEKQWTMQALHLACALARNAGASVTLVHMIPVQHASWLGTEFAQRPLTGPQYAELRGMQATAEDYGVELVYLSFQYITLAEALAEAADHVDASTVFAVLPSTIIPFWQRFQTWLLERRLKTQKRALFTLGDDTRSEVSTPAIMVRVSR